MTDDVQIHEEPIGSQIQFRYTNYRGDDHVYRCEMTTDSLVFEHNAYKFPDAPDYKTWNLRLNVLERDGEEREGGRQFLLRDIRDLSEVPS